ncbi:MAG: 23S rRNA (adenine(2503)-C(2))-methyltransferase RlmN [Patescibacteria group bacterium]|jgi:adenine C2-methylase RlmN of 23S rRNA A2503 and tRNA A37|nr:23S rRNA (adenine(2503)-C(2))-methyltransferase RlmN [Patescibacteria group bacterium]
MDLKAIEKFFSTQAKFRFKQMQKLLFQDLIDNWSQASVLPLVLRDELNKKYPLIIPGDLFLSRDQKSAKALVALEDGNSVETALMVHSGKRNTVCLSSQLGCPLACQFCSSGQSFKRNLTWEEILKQVFFWQRYLKSKKLGPLTNVVFMGSGEAFLNYDQVFKAIRYLNQAEYFNISSRKISISTIGLVPGIRRMAQEKIKVNLSLSLHFLDDKLRSEIMPGTKKYPLAQVFQALDFYIEKTNRKVMLEYLIIKDLNDSVAEAKKLADFIGRKSLYIINIIRYNETGRFKAPDRKTILNFKKVLEKRGLEVIERFRFNQDVQGACGQLANKYNN